MARYFFDIFDREQLWRDAEGTECEGQEAVRLEAMNTLPEIARHAIPDDGDRQAFTVPVRDETDVTVYTATLSFAGRWLGDTPIPEPPSDD